MNTFDEIYSRHVDMVYRICFLYLKKSHDAEEATQETFIKYLRYSPYLENESHEKAWFIKTASNICKNLLKSSWWKKIIPYKEIVLGKEEPSNQLLEDVLSLPDKYKMPIYLFYYEGYTTEEISKMIGVKASTVKSHLHRGRKLLKANLEGGELNG